MANTTSREKQERLEVWGGAWTWWDQDGGSLSRPAGAQRRSLRTSLGTISPLASSPGAALTPSGHPTWGPPINAPAGPRLRGGLVEALEGREAAGVYRWIWDGRLAGKVWV